MSKFDFFDVVIITTDRESYQEVNGSEAVILGKSENEFGDWGYSVQVIASEETWYLPESELVPTGRQLARDEVYDGSNVKVGVNSDSGEGNLVND